MALRGLSIILDETLGRVLGLGDLCWGMSFERLNDSITKVLLLCNIGCHPALKYAFSGLWTEVARKIHGAGGD